MAEKRDHFEPFLVNLEVPELDIRAIIRADYAALFSHKWAECHQLGKM